MAVMLEVLNGSSGRSAATERQVPAPRAHRPLRVRVHQLAHGQGRAALPACRRRPGRAGVDRRGHRPRSGERSPPRNRARLHPHLSLHLHASLRDPGGTMTDVTTKPLSDQRRCRGARRRPSSACSTTTTLADECLELLDRYGVLVFRELHLDDDTQVAFSRQAGPGGAGRSSGRRSRDLPGDARPGEEPGGRLPQGHVRLAHRRHDRRHPDHGHRAQRARGRRSRAATPSSPAPTPPTRTSPPTSRNGRSTTRVVHSFLAAQKLSHPNASADDIEMWSKRPPKTHPLVWRHEHGRRSLVLGATDRPRRGHGRGGRARLPRRPARPLDGARARVPARVGGRRPRHLGQPGRAAPRHTCTTRRRHATCTARTIAGDEAVQ